MSRAHSTYDWPHHIAQQKVSGLSIKEYSAQQGFPSWSFYANRQKLVRFAVSQKKVPVQTKPAFLNLGTLQQSNLVSISFPDGTRVEINAQQSTDDLCSILKTLRNKGGAKC
jgi:hypothetical protein